LRQELHTELPPTRKKGGRKTTADSQLALAA